MSAVEEKDEETNPEDNPVVIPSVHGLAERGTVWEEVLHVLPDDYKKGGKDVCRRRERRRDQPRGQPVVIPSVHGLAERGTVWEEVLRVLPDDYKKGGKDVCRRRERRRGKHAVSRGQPVVILTVYRLAERRQAWEEGLHVPSDCELQRGFRHVACAGGVSIRVSTTGVNTCEACKRFFRPVDVQEEEFKVSRYVMSVETVAVSFHTVSAVRKEIFFSAKYNVVLAIFLKIYSKFKLRNNLYSLCHEERNFFFLCQTR